MMVDQVEMLRVLLAHSERWQELVAAAGSDPVSQALDFIHDGQVEQAGEDKPSRTFAVVEEIERTRQIAGTATWRGSGALMISLQATVPDEAAGSYAESRQWFMGLINQIQSEMETISASRATPLIPGTNTPYGHSHFQIRQMNWSLDPFQIPEVEREDVETTDDVLANPEWAVQWRVEY